MDSNSNENKEVISVSGQKTWEDNENQDGKRPTTITVNLLADGQPIQHKEVSEKDDWRYRFKLWKNTRISFQRSY
ncbi:Cna B-type domain-containing protein [Enterococcus faecium]|uniref:Cna B-type domain-containing protein n=1 Tax=Enterococcus faecium TaxID=1352 RepID=UPI002A5A66C9|nr:Cna B-type domain-containing protein [Enterococcus faecium]